jgi:hypothetical protein
MANLLFFYFISCFLVRRNSVKSRDDGYLEAIDFSANALTLFLTYGLTTRRITSIVSS